MQAYEDRERALGLDLVKALDINNIRIKNIVNKIIHKNKQKEISLIKILLQVKCTR